MNKPVLSERNTENGVCVLLYAKGILLAFEVISNYLTTEKNSAWTLK